LFGRYPGALVTNQPMPSTGKNDIATSGIAPQADMTRMPKIGVETRGGHPLLETPLNSV
jgi:hypothetical protein